MFIKNIKSCQEFKFEIKLKLLYAFSLYVPSALGYWITIRWPCQA